MEVYGGGAVEPTIAERQYVREDRAFRVREGSNKTPAKVAFSNTQHALDAVGWFEGDGAGRCQEREGCVFDVPGTAAVIKSARVLRDFLFFTRGSSTIVFVFAEPSARLFYLLSFIPSRP